MSPPEVWGPAVWTLFHTLIEQLNPNAYPHIIGSLFGMIVRICKVLPCPECSKDASNFLAKINLSHYKTKDEFKNMMYLFHNWVNAKKRKPLFNYAHMNNYANIPLPHVINRFIATYHTKGNMKMLTETFQRSMVVKDFIAWFKACSGAFVIATKPEEIVVKQKEETVVEQEETVVEPQETTQEETVLEQEDIQPIHTEEQIVKKKRGRQKRK